MWNATLAPLVCDRHENIRRVLMIFVYPPMLPQHVTDIDVDYVFHVHGFTSLTVGTFPFALDFFHINMQSYSNPHFTTYSLKLKTAVRKNYMGHKYIEILICCIISILFIIIGILINVIYIYILNDSIVMKKCKLFLYFPHRQIICASSKYIQYYFNHFITNQLCG